MKYYSSMADLVKIFIRIQWLVFCEVELIFSAGVSYQTEDISERSEVTRYPPVMANLSKEWNLSKSSPHEDKHQTHTAGEKQNNFITFIAVFIFLVSVRTIPWTLGEPTFFLFFFYNGGGGGGSCAYNDLQR